MRSGLVGVGLLVLALAGCDAARTDDEAAAPMQADTALPAPVLDQLEAQPLRARAEAALREQRLHTPAGNNAVEYYLALREREPDAGVAAALAELQPYVLIATEQALGQQQLDEARRLVGLLARMDTHAPALPRLRESLRVAQERADRDEGARVAEAARPVVPPIAPAPAPSPARTLPPSAPLPSSPPTATVAAQPPAPEPAAPKEPAPPTPLARTEPAPTALPRLLRDAAPRYPLAARNRRIEGSVQVAFTIQPDGSVTDVRAVSAQPEGLFEQAALAAAARWQFESTPRRVSTTRTLTFQLPREPSS